MSKTLHTALVLLAVHVGGCIDDASTEDDGTGGAALPDTVAVDSLTGVSVANGGRQYQVDATVGNYRFRGSLTLYPNSGVVDDVLASYAGGGWFPADTLFRVSKTGGEFFFERAVSARRYGTTTYYNFPNWEQMVTDDWRPNWDVQPQLRGPRAYHLGTMMKRGTVKSVCFFLDIEPERACFKVGDFYIDVTR